MINNSKNIQNVIDNLIVKYIKNDIKTLLRIRLYDEKIKSLNK